MAKFDNVGPSDSMFMREINQAVTRKQRRKIIRQAVFEATGKKMSDRELATFEGLLKRGAKEAWQH